MRSRLVLAIVLLASIAASAQTVTVNYKVFGGAKGEVLAPFSIFQGTPGKNIILGAPKEILVQDPANPAKPKTYVFLFWVVPGPPLANGWFASGGPTTNTEVAFKVPLGGAHTSAWYELTCTVNCGDAISYVSAFAEDEDEQMAGTPIASVIPSGLWNPNQTPNYVNESNTNPVVITAKPAMDNKKFHLWLPLSMTPISGNTLTVPVKQTTSAIAFYHTANPPPPPCQQWTKVILAAEVEIGKALSNQPPDLQGLAQAKEDVATAKAGYAACLRNPKNSPVPKVP
jgi:hypothetical protein